MTDFATPPPLPDPRALVAGSAWIAGRPGLAEAAAGWQRNLPAVRRSLEREALELARPRLWSDTLGSLAGTGWKVITAAAPDAPFALLSAAAAAAGLPISPPRDAGGTLKRAERLVRAGGPAYIKLGQFISSARGLLPDPWVDAFAWCRDQAPTLDPRVAESTLESRLGARRSRIRAFNPVPIAAASIAQVHEATLDDGSEVVIKLRRPDLRRRFATDIETMALVAALGERLHEVARTANLSGFVELFAQLVLEELDFRLEALNTVELGAAFEDAGIDFCTVPRPIPDLVTDGVLAMERVHGVPYDRAEATFGGALDGDRLLNLAIRGVLETTLVYGIFHGDLHAGNVLIDGGERFSLVDFGICGRIDATERAALVQFMLAFAQNDARAQLEALRHFKALPDDVDMDRLAAELQEQLRALDPSSGAQLTFDGLGQTASGILRLLSAHRFRLPKELVLFFKNLLYLSSFTASIAPDADLLAQVAPILAHFMGKYGEQLAVLAPVAPPPETETIGVSER